MDRQVRALQQTTHSDGGALGAMQRLKEINPCCPSFPSLALTSYPTRSNNLAPSKEN
ncbi:MAG: hypothetical protein KJ729_01700 [Euryarchaeota archaeon]|nr:hypothetical protein [Euryarchaeota archaeon]